MVPGRWVGLPGWWTDLARTGHESPDFPGGHGNLGMSHGTAPLALLSLGLRRGVVVAGQVEAIGRICTWLDAWRQDHPCEPWWPGFITAQQAEQGRLRRALLTTPAALTQRTV